MRKASSRRQRSEPAISAIHIGQQICAAHVLLHIYHVTWDVAV